MFWYIEGNYMFIIAALPHASELFQLVSDSFDLPLFKNEHLYDTASGTLDDLMKIENTVTFANTYKVI